MARFRTASWQGAGLDPRAADRARRDEATVRRGFWSKLRRVAAGLPFAENLLAAYYCAFDRETPLQVKAALLAALAYFVLPVDMMPDVLPLANDSLPGLALAYSISSFTDFAGMLG